MRTIFCPFCNSNLKAKKISRTVKISCKTCGVSCNLINIEFWVRGRPKGMKLSEIHKQNIRKATKGKLKPRKKK